MITVKEFRSLVNQCNKDWNIVFKKWGHNMEGLWPVKVSLKLLKCINQEDSYGTINKTIYIFEDDYDNTFMMEPDKILELFCNYTKNDYDFLDFRLNTPEGNINLAIKGADQEYKNKQMFIEFEEKIV